MANIDRVYAIFNFEKEDFDFLRLAEIFPFKENSEISFFTCFSKNAAKAEKAGLFKEVHLLPSEIIDSESKSRNYVADWYFDKQYKCFVHVVSDALLVKNDNLQVFVSAIEEMMAALDQIVWFSTRSDICNYIFEKYNPKFRICVDEKNKKNYEKTIFFTPFANTAWVIFDYSKVDDKRKVELDIDFSIPMFFIVEYLSRRRTFQPAFMNCYPTVEEERWVFDISSMFDITKTKPDKFSQAIYEKENTLFMEKKIDFTSMWQLEKVFEMVCGVLGIDPLVVGMQQQEQQKQQEQKQ